MKVVEKYWQSTSRIGMEGALMALSPLPFLFIVIGVGSAMPNLWQLLLASVATTAAIVSGLLLTRQPFLGKLSGAIALAGTFTTILPWLTDNPFVALTGAVSLIGASFALMDFPIDSLRASDKKTRPLIDTSKRLDGALWWSLCSLFSA